MPNCVVIGALQSACELGSKVIMSIKSEICFMQRDLSIFWWQNLVLSASITITIMWYWQRRERKFLHLRKVKQQAWEENNRNRFYKHHVCQREFSVSQRESREMISHDLENKRKFEPKQTGTLVGIFQLHKHRMKFIFYLSKHKNTLNSVLIM